MDPIGEYACHWNTEQDNRIRTLRARRYLGRSFHFPFPFNLRLACELAFQNSGDLLEQALEDTRTKGDVTPAPVPVPVSVFQPMFTPDTGTGTFALESLVPAPSLELAPSVEYLPPY